jgi:hypothetical protein
LQAEILECLRQPRRGVLERGEKDLAVQNYQKSVELNPKNQSGIDALKKLSEQK